MPRKLCYICEATQGGVRKHLRDLFEHFSRPESNLHVHALLGDRGEPGFHEELEAFKKGGRFTYQIVPEMKRPIRPLRDWKAYVVLKELLRDLAPDVIHTHSSKAGFIGRSAANHLGIKNVIHTPHVFPFQWSSGLVARIYTALEKHTSSFTRTLVCVGDGQRDDVLKRRICEASKLVVIRNGIEVPPPITPEQRSAARKVLDIPENVPLVGMVARLAPQKGVGNFVRAAARVLKQNPETRFVVVGGPMGGAGETEVRERMADMQVGEKSFILAGHRPDADSLYAAFDIVALSSLYEGLPYVLLEAMAHGLPVVATDVLGSRDVVVEGDTGLLAPVNNPARIAEQIQKLLNDSALREKLGDNARNYVRREFSYDAFLKGHEALYNAPFSP